MRYFASLALLPLALAAPARRSSPAPLLVPRDAQLIEGKYIVKMRAEVAGEAVASAVSSIAADAAFTYSDSFHGFAASMTPEEVDKIRANPDVELVEQDAVVNIFQTQTQSDADWGLARLSSNKPGGSTYTFDSSAGEGTCAYVIDTGVDETHPEFEGRAKLVNNLVDNSKTDDHGHGTHVSGTIGSKTFGVAKKTKIFGVKVLGANGGGSNSVVIAGMEFVVKDARGQSCPKGIVVNMSLGGGRSAVVNEAAAKIASSGLFLAVAAGNDGQPASEYSPASAPAACTVGATDKADRLATYSNVGAGVDVLAPGSNITSTWKDGDTNTISGTSMASPHVAGLAAYFMGLGQKAESLCEFMAQNALKDVIRGVPSDTKNLLIHNKASNSTQF